MFEPLGMDLTPAKLRIEQLHLDPNNPRLVGPDHVPRNDEEALNEAVQEELRLHIRRNHSISALMDSMESSGYLPIDRIVVREVVDGAYVVLEGNRRVAAVKELLLSTDKRSLNDGVLDSLKEIPALVYTGTDPKAAWIFQGIRHISGVKDWPAYNKARLLVEQMEENELNFTDAGRAFGLTSHQAGQYVRGYYAFSHALGHSDFQDDVDERLFPYLQELFGRSNIALRNWLKWDDVDYVFQDEAAFHEFLEWMYVKVDDNHEFDPDVRSDWDERRIPRAIDLREVSSLLRDSADEFLAFRTGMPLSTALARAKAKAEQDSETAEEWTKELKGALETLARLPVVQLQDSAEADEIVAALDAIQITAKRAVTLMKTGAGADE